jgi:SAM-dependent methyltransferase
VIKPLQHSCSKAAAKGSELYFPGFGDTPAAIRFVWLQKQIRLPRQPGGLTVTQSFSGHYPIERRAGEIERLSVQGAAMAPDTRAMLDLIGVKEGWSCLDIGCGPCGITDILSEYVGPSGRVVGLDMDAEFIGHARANANGRGNTFFVQGDAYSADLPADSFDLVHMRFVASTAGEPQRLLKEATRLARPGGYVALQEPDGDTLNCYPPHPSWDRLKAALLGSFSGVGADLRLAKRLYSVVYESGLQNVQYRPFLIGVRSTDPMVDYLPATVESLRGTVIRLGLVPEEEFSSVVAECRGHLRKPGTAFTMYTVAQVWGRKPQ